MLPVKILITAGLSESSMGAHAQKYVVWRWGSNKVTKKKAVLEARPSRATERRDEKQKMTEDTTTPEDCDIWKKQNKKKKNIYYENTPIQIYWKFHDQKLKVFR